MAAAQFTLSGLYIWLSIALGGAIGAVGRYGFIRLVHALPVGADFFFLATLAVNILGCFLAGIIFAAVHLGDYFSPAMRDILFVGFLGGLTTFSAFTIEAWILIERKDWLFASAYCLASVIFAFFAFALGYCLFKWLG